MNDDDAAPGPSSSIHRGRRSGWFCEKTAPAVVLPDVCELTASHFPHLKMTRSTEETT